MHKRIQLYATIILLVILMLPLLAAAQDAASQQATTTVNGWKTMATDVIAPFVAVCGCLVAGYSLFFGEGGRFVKIGLGVLAGAVIMAHAQDIWQALGGH
jgi:type IV secretory pathway VirB2 component (pilin)